MIEKFKIYLMQLPKFIWQKNSHYLFLMRFDKPIGTLLLLWPTLWALWLANHKAPSFRLFIIFVLGVTVMRAAGCVINDIADRNVDGYVKRTQQRPLASGKVSLKNALILFFILIFLAFILVLQLNWQTIFLSTFAVILASFYPFTKRFFPAPQLFLSFAFAFGILMAYSASVGKLPLESWWLYGLTLPWMIAYDTCYAMVDQDDDQKIGIHSTAVFFGQYTILWIIIFQSLFLVLFLGFAFYLNLSTLFYSSLFIALLLSCYIFYLLSFKTRASYFQAFKLNHWIGFILFAGIYLSYY